MKWTPKKVYLTIMNNLTKARGIRKEYWRSMGVKIHPNAIIGDCTIDTAVPENITIENGAILATGCTILAHEPLNSKVWKVRIGNNAWIGAGAIVMRDVGDNSYVGAGAVVTKPVPAGEVWVGVPARKLKDRAFI